MDRASRGAARRPSARTDRAAGQPGDAAIYSGAIFLNSDYDGPSARARMAEGVADGISFGRPFIANPDLVDRIAVARAQRAGMSTTFYRGAARAISIIPALAEQAAA